MERLPRPYRNFCQRHPDVAAAHDQLAGLCHEAGPLTERERILVKLGLCMGARLEGGLHAQVRQALRHGLSADDLRHACLLACTTLGFPTMMTALTWIEDLLPKRRVKKAPAAGKPAARKTPRRRTR